jgi:hypothetical protein
MSNYKVPTIAGHVFAVVSLLCCLAFWMGLILFFLFPKVVLLPNPTGFQAFKIMAVVLVFAVVATILRSKLWRFALPISAATFLLVWYAMVT